MDLAVECGHGSINCVDSNAAREEQRYKKIISAIIQTML